MASRRRRVSALFLNLGSFKRRPREYLSRKSGGRGRVALWLAVIAVLVLSVSMLRLPWCRFSGRLSARFIVLEVGGSTQRLWSNSIEATNVRVTGVDRWRTADGFEKGMPQVGSDAVDLEGPIVETGDRLLLSVDGARLSATLLTKESPPEMLTVHRPGKKHDRLELLVGERASLSGQLAMRVTLRVRVTSLDTYYAFGTRQVASELREAKARIWPAPTPLTLGNGLWEGLSVRLRTPAVAEIVIEPAAGGIEVSLAGLASEVETGQAEERVSLRPRVLALAQHPGFSPAVAFGAMVISIVALLKAARDRSER